MADNIEINPTVEVSEDVEVSPTIDLHGSVDMGSTASEYNAEAWAVGERHGVPVGEGDQTYHNNAKYYAELAGAEKDAAILSAQEALQSEQLALGAKEGAEDAAELAAQKAQEAVETVVAAQGPGICYIGTDGIPFVLE